jgi:tetratricopeptide (TPR) repeat protein
MPAMQCPACAAAVPDGFQYCDKCACPMDQRCPHCGAPARPEGKFCGRCGATLHAATSAEAGHAPLLVERRHVSILFADLVGFTHVSESLDPEDVRDLLSRYLDTAAAVPDGPDADSLRALARERLLRAAERAGSLGATSESITHYETLIGLLPPGDELAGIAERAAEAPLRGARYELALQYVALARQSISQIDARSAARLATLEGNVLIDIEQPQKARDTTQPAYAGLADAPAELATRDWSPPLQRPTRGLAMTSKPCFGERASVLAQDLGAWDVLADSVNSRGLGLIATGRWVEALSMLRMALDLCLSNDLGSAALRPYINLAALSLTRNIKEAETYAEDGLALARRLGHRLRGEFLFYHLLMAHVMAGRWDEVEQAVQELPLAADVPILRQYVWWPVVIVRALRGDPRAGDAAMRDEPEDQDAQSRLAYASQRAELAFMEGRLETAFSQAGPARRHRAGPPAARRGCRSVHAAWRPAVHGTRPGRQRWKPRVDRECVHPRAQCGRRQRRARVS